MTDLFEPTLSDDSDCGLSAAGLPLAERLRPTTLSDVLGQDHLLGPNAPIGRMLAAGRLSSIVFWGGPGTGKTSIARLLADAAGLRFKSISAVTTNVSELKSVFAEAKMLAESGKRTALFVDEIHRMTKSVQDQLLAPIETGVIVLIGATTEHPAYELNNAIQSRTSVLILKQLESAALEELLLRAEALMGKALPITAEARESLLAQAQGDGRFLINQAESLFAMELPEPLDIAGVSEALGARLPNGDKDREYHFDMVSALQKSVRGSDPDAALYWFAQMLERGEDMKFILRRLTIMASEEVGVADPQALAQCIAARQAYEFLGSPEGEYAVAQAIVYVSTAPKSNATYLAYHAARELAKATPGVYPPINIINHPTARLAKERGYIYDHDLDGAFSGQNHWPEGVGRRKLYRPNARGLEAQIAKRIEHWDGIRDEKSASLP
jgi:putative ATPase